MALALLLIVLVICVVIVSILAHSLLYPQIRKRENIKLDDLPTGSIVLVGHINRKYVMNLAGINTNHAAMVVRDGKKIYLVEMARHRDKSFKDSHAILVDAREYLKNNNIYVLVRKYKGKNPISTMAVKKAMERLSHHHINMDYTHEFMYHHYSPTSDLRDPESRGVSCAEYIYKLKCELGITDLNPRVFTDAYRHLEFDDNVMYAKMCDLSD